MLDAKSNLLRLPASISCSQAKAILDAQSHDVFQSAQPAECRLTFYAVRCVVVNVYGKTFAEVRDCGLEGTAREEFSG